ncbi:MAG TPA: hypothetical protein VGB22_04475 [candidate division Zixibacteria bacterium]|jgi:hypothetical protein
MTALGWVFLTLSMIFVWGLVIWCYAKVFTIPEEEFERQEAHPAEHTYIP